MLRNIYRNNWTGVCLLLGMLALLSVLNSYRQTQKKPTPGYPNSDPETAEQIMVCREDSGYKSSRFSLSPAEDLAIVSQGKGLCWLSCISNQNHTRKTPHEIALLDGFEHTAFSGNGRRLVVIGQQKGLTRIAMMDARSRVCMSVCPLIRPQNRPNLRVSHKGDHVALRATEYGIHPTGMEAITIRETKQFTLTGSVMVPPTAIVADMNLTDDYLHFAYNITPNCSEMQIYTKPLNGGDPSLQCKIETSDASRFESARFSRKGDRLVVSRLFGEHLRVYDLPSGEILSQLPHSMLFASNGEFCGYALSHDGKKLATASGAGAVMIWDVTTNPARNVGEMMETLGQKCSYLAFGHDDSTIVAIVDNSIMVWDILDRVVTNKCDRPTQ